MKNSDIVSPTLVVNCGSSSLKYALISADNQNRIVGLAESLGLDEARIIHKGLDGTKTEVPIPNADHRVALEKILTLIEDYRPVAVGHRAVHGGKAFSNAIKVEPRVLSEIKRLSTLAPLHNPANVIGIEAVQAIYPDLPQVAVFDTAFHQTMPPVAYRYAIPKSLYTEHHIRRYGFHGTSHAYVSNRASKLQAMSDKDNNNIKDINDINNIKYGWLTAHLGNGCSATAVYDGKSLDSSMGLTPLEGLMMGTRSGDIDPGLHIHLKRTLDMSLEDIDTMLNKKSGLLGVSTLSNDMRTIEEVADDDDHPHQQDAKLALEMFCYRVGKYLASLSCALPEFTGIVFTGGIGENGASIRAKILTVMRHFGLSVDNDKNERLFGGAEGSFHKDDSRYQLWVIPTDEEYQIAEETRQVLGL